MQVNVTCLAHDSLIPRSLSIGLCNAALFSTADPPFASGAVRAMEARPAGASALLSGPKCR